MSPLERDQLFSKLHRSIKADLIHCASHCHGLFRDDNAQVYYKLEEATRGTAYADSIKPFEWTKNGRGAFLALRSQYDGKDKYEAEIVKQDNLLHTCEWKGQSNFTLERFIQQHRNSYAIMKSCCEHVADQLPNSHTCVGYLIHAIKCDDAGLQAAIANILDDKNGKRQDFEAAAAYLLPKDPVAKRRATGQKQSSVEISDTTVKKVSAKGKSPKVGIGTTGVHFRCYTPKDYAGLSKEQKMELTKWRAKTDVGKKSTPKPPASKNASKRQKREAALISKSLGVQ